jgi:hypothetical protein
MYPVYFLLLGALLGALQILFTGTGAVQAFLLGFIVSNVGLQGIFAFLGHFFRSDETARGIGWPEGNPFQKEIAFTNLSLGVLGLMSIWFRGEFWLATIVARSVFTWGAGCIHAADLRKRKNVSVFNAGPVLWFDILYPFLIIGLYVAWTAGA